MTTGKGKKLCKGIAKYLKIKNMYCDNKIDDDFLNEFYSFYGLWRQKQNINREPDCRVF